MADLSQQVVPGESRVFPAPRPGVGDDLGSASARSLGTSFLRDETGKPVGVVGRLHMVEGGTADPEALDHLGDGESVDPMAAEHLVANLEQIAGIEKGPGAEQFVSDLLGMRVEKSTGTQEGGLRVGGWVLGHQETSRWGRSG